MPPNGQYAGYTAYGPAGSQGMQPQQPAVMPNYGVGAIDPRTAVRQPGIAPAGAYGYGQPYPAAPYGPPQPAAYGPAVIAPTVTAQPPAVPATPQAMSGRTGLSQMGAAAAPSGPLTPGPNAPNPAAGFQFPASSATRYVQQMSTPMTAAPPMMAGQGVPMPGQPYRQGFVQRIRPLVHIEGRHIRPKLVMVLLAAVVLLIGGGVLVSRMSGAGGIGSQSADSLMQDALQNALRTKSYTQKVKDPLKGVTAEYKIDVSNIEKPIVSGSASLTSSHMELDGYATGQDTYTNLKSADKFAYPSAIGAWMQVRAAGTVLDTTGSGGQMFDQLFTPLLGPKTPVIFGNYSDSQRADMLGIIRDKLVIRYDPATAQQDKVDGQTVVRYDVTFDREGGTELFRKAAVLANFDQKRIDEAVALERLSSGTSQTQATLSVSPKTKQIVHIDLMYRDGTRSVSFSGFDSTQVGAAPKAQYRWDQFVAARQGR